MCASYLCDSSPAFVVRANMASFLPLSQIQGDYSRDISFKHVLQKQNPSKLGVLYNEYEK